jgi:hypothetical protein
MSSYGQRQRTLFREISGSTVLAAADDLSSTPRVLVPLAAKYTIFIQKITVNVITDNAATQNFEDNATTPVIIAKTKASPGIGPILFDFGEEGRPLTEGKQFELKSSAAGLAADITWLGYIKPTATRIPSEI